MDKIKELLTRKYTKSEAIGIIFSIVAVGLIIDIVLGRFSIFFIVLSLTLLAIGYRQFKKRNNTMAYLLMAIGGGFLLVALITSLAFALIFVALIIYNCYQLFRSSTNPASININIDSNAMNAENFIQTTPYFKNKIVGEYRLFQEDYPVEDINIQTGFGDVSIDLSDKIIPVGETVLLIRGMIGSIYLNVPSDVGLSVQMSLLCGKMKLLTDSKTNLNVTQKYQSVAYKEASRKIKIVASLLVGDIEVRHR